MSQEFTKIPSPLHFFLNQSSTQKYHFLPSTIIHKNWKNCNVNERPTVKHIKMENRMAPIECLGNNMQVQTMLYVKGNGFKWVLNKLNVTVWAVFMWFRIGRTSSIFHNFLDTHFSKAVPCTELIKPFFSAHINHTWYLDISCCFSKGQCWHALSFFDSRIKQRVQVGNNSILYLGHEHQNKSHKYCLLGCDNTMSFGRHTWCCTSEHCTMTKATVGTGI